LDTKEPTCALNLRKFPKDVRKRLNKIAQDFEEDVQDFAPRWLRERLDQEEKKLAELGKSSTKRK
jgi:hypothetical protein